MATVTQADRIAAAYGSSSIQYVKDDILAGKLDDHPRVVSYAAHREASTTQLEADRAELLEVATALDREWSMLFPHGPGEDGEPHFMAPATVTIWRKARAAIARIEGDRS
jgi:hypothetical protein